MDFFLDSQMFFRSLLNPIVRGRRPAGLSVCEAEVLKSFVVDIGL